MYDEDWRTGSCRAVFDVIPYHLLTVIITENGKVSLPFEENS
jgi:hypothetical protein